MHSLKHINVYSSLHGKTIERKAALCFLGYLQDDITSGRITKAKDKYCKEIARIQKSLLGILNHKGLSGCEEFKITIVPASLKRYNEILKAQGLGVIPAVLAAAGGKFLEVHLHKLFGGKGLAGVEDMNKSDAHYPEFTQFKHKPREAIKHLIKVKKGQCLSALHRSDVGDIDIIWGENDKDNIGFGLKHIIEKHGKEINALGFKVEDFIPIVIQFGEFNIKKSIDEKKVFDSRYFRFVIQTTFHGKDKVWLLTTFDLSKKLNKKSLGTIKTVLADCFTLGTLLQETNDGTNILKKSETNKSVKNGNNSGVSGASVPKKSKKIDGIETITKKEALSLGIITDGIGFVEKDIYKNINKKLLEYINSKKELPWRKPWRDGYKIKGKTYGVQNYVTANPYHGGNAFMIAMMNWINKTNYNYFLTKKQVNDRGGSLKKDAKPIDVFVYIKSEKIKIDKKTSEEKKYQYSGVIGYEVYPLEHTENVKPVKRKIEQPEVEDEVIVDAETVIENMPKKPPIKNDGGNKAYYMTISDSVHVPVKGAFDKIQQYYGVLFHELIHSTGNAKRLDRNMKGNQQSKEYAFEELIAEIGAAYLCGVTDIDYYTLQNSAAYLKGWMSKLKSEITTDKSFLFRSVFAATRASKYIIGNTLIKKGEVKLNFEK